MKATLKRPTVKFDDIFEGDVFLHSEALYMKVYDDSHRFNAVSLDEGALVKFETHDDVQLVDGEFCYK